MAEGATTAATARTRGAREDRQDLWGSAENNVVASEVVLSPQVLESQGYLVRTAKGEKRQIVRLLQSLTKAQQVFETFGD